MQTSNERYTTHPSREIHLRDYLVVLDRYKWLIVAAVLVTLSATVLHLRRQVPVYQAQARIIIEPRQVTEVFSSQSVFFGTDWLDLETQIVAITTTPVLAMAVRQLGLTTAPEGSLEFSHAVNALRGSVAVKLIENTKMATITATALIPERARDIANAVAQGYIDQDRLSRLQTGRDAVRWLSVQLADLKIKLKQSEEVFQEFKEREKIVTLDDRRTEESMEIARLNASYITARANRLEIEAIIDKLESESGLNLSIPIALLDTPVLQTLGTELSKLQAELADKKKDFKDTYPGVIELKERIQLKEQKILAELKRQRDFLEAQEQLLLAQQESKRSETLKLGRKELEYLTLEREVTTNRGMYNALLSKVKELSLGGETDLSNIRIVEPAELPSAATGNKTMTLVFGGMLGLFLGIGFAFFLKYLENTIRTPDDVEQHLNLPVLGVVPRVSEARESKTPLLLLKGNPKSAPAEAYRSIRTNILFSRLESSPTHNSIDSLTNRPIDQSTNRPIDQSTNRPTDQSTHPRTIVITSAGPKEGKTFTVANLGMALAQAGQKVLLVDADLRRPMLHRVFNLNRGKGLSTVLAEEITLDEAIEETPVPNLSVLTTGSVPANPSEVLGSAQMRDIMDSVREQYDVVLLDSAPVLGMTDTAVLASECDTVAMVIKTGEATRKALKMAIAQLEQVGAKICGVVLNDVDIGRDRYYYYYYYYYYYSPYGDDEDRTSRRRKKRRRSSGRKTITKGPSPTRS